MEFDSGCKDDRVPEVKESDKTEVHLCKIVKCPMCRHYVTISNFSRHKQTKHPHRIFKKSHHKQKYQKKAESLENANGSFVCPEPCGKTFNRSDNFADHQKTKTCKLNHTVRCTICHQSFFGFKQLNYHFKKRRCNKLFKCLNCNGDFRKEKDLVSHIETCSMT